MSSSLYDTISVNTASCNVGIGTNPSAAFDLSIRSDAICLPCGTSAQRPSGLLNYILRFNTEISNLEFKIDDSWVVLGIVPKIITATNLVLKNKNDSTIVSCSNITSDSVWTFIDNFGNSYNPKSISNVSSTSVTLVRPDIMPPEKGPYYLKVKQLGRYNTLRSFTAGNAPYFSTIGGSLGAFNNSSIITPIDITANDEVSGGIINMQLSTGVLPSGLTGIFAVNGTGGKYTISGTPSQINTDTTYPCTISAIDSGNNIVSQLFSITINAYRTVTLTTANFSAPGTAGANSTYNAAVITLPALFARTISWDLTFNAYKNLTNYGFAYPYIGIKNAAGTVLAEYSITGASNVAQSIQRKLLEKTEALGVEGAQLTCYLKFFTYSNLVNCNFVLTVRYSQ